VKNLSEEKKPDIKTKKEEKREQRQQGKAYLKAQYNYRIGYLIKSIKTFFKENFIYYIKKYTKAIMIVMLIISVIFLFIGINQFIRGHEASHNASRYQASNQKLQSKSDELSADLRQENKKINSASVSTQSGVKRAKKTIDKVFNGMYDYHSSGEYRDNRKQNIEYFDNPKAKWINDVYSDDKDEDGNSQIDTLGLTSDLENTEIYTESIKDTSKKVVPFKVVVSYAGNIEDVSSEYATRTHYTTYKVDVDTSNNKITKMKKINTVKVNNEIS
jgi:hypothetical protein